MSPITFTIIKVDESDTHAGIAIFIPIFDDLEVISGADIRRCV